MERGLAIFIWLTIIRKGATQPVDTRGMRTTSYSFFNDFCNCYNIQTRQGGTFRGNYELWTPMATVEKSNYRRSEE